MKDLYRAIRKRALKTYGLVGIAVILCGLLIMIISISDSPIYKYFFENKPSLSNINSIEFSDGKWLTCDTNELYEPFASDDNGKYYVARTNDNKYFAFYVYNDKVDEAEIIVNDTYNSLRASSDEYSATHLTGKGYLTTMDSEVSEYFTNYFESDGSSISDYDVEYYVYKYSSLSNIILNESIDDSFVGIIIILIGLAMLLYIILGGYKTNIKKQMKQYSVTEGEIDADLNSAQKSDGAYIGENFTILYTTSKMILVPYNVMIWMYMHIDRFEQSYSRKSSGPHIDVCYIMLLDRHNRKQKIEVKSEKIGNQILTAIHSRAPYLFVGYSEEIKNALNNGHFNELVQSVQKKYNDFYLSQNPVSEDIPIIPYIENKEAVH